LGVVVKLMLSNKKESCDSMSSTITKKGSRFKNQDSRFDFERGFGRITTNYGEKKTRYLGLFYG
jgi:hypothetical protein